MMNLNNMIGTIAAVLTTVSFVPQAFKILKTKQTHDISLSMYVLFAVGVLMWLIYGAQINSLPIIFANAITLCLIIPILIMKLIYK
jgi:MtN3 and saliva related transmembrane protein